MLSHDTIVYLASHPAVVGGRIEDAATVVTETVGRAAGVARASVWLLEKGATELRCLDLYQREQDRHYGTPPLTAREFPRYFAALQSHRAIPAEDALHDSRTSELALRYLRAHGIGAMLDSGIRHGGSIVGVVCLEHVGGPRAWSDDEIAFAGAAADQFALALSNAELRRSFASLEASERTLRAILDNVPELFVVVDRRGTIVFVNRGIGETAREDVVGTDVVSWQEPRFHEPFAEALAAASRGRAGRTVEARGWGSSKRWYQNRFLPVTSADGATHVQILAEEISGAKHVERLLIATAQESFGLTGKSFLDAVVRRVALTTEADFVFIGEIAQDGNRCRTLAVWRDGRLDEGFSYALEGTPCERVVEMGVRCYPADLQRSFPDNEWIRSMSAEAYVGVPLWDTSGAAIGLMALLFRRPLEDPQLVQSTLSMFSAHVSAMLETLKSEDARRSEGDRRLEAVMAASKLKDEFLLTLSHELRTPMTSILGWATLLRGGRARPEDAQRGLDAIVKNAEAELRQIDEVLELATILAGRLALTRAPVELRALVAQEVEAARPSANARTVTLVVTVPDEELWLEGEDDRLREIVRQLIENAVKFSRAGGRADVTLGADLTTITLVVHDDGVGVGSDFLPEVFEAFRQEDAGLSRSYGGLGIGLTVARALAEAHGGALTAESPGRGGGATFTVTLPRSRVSPRGTAPRSP